MKKIILYDTRYGFTKECADYVKNLFPESDLFHIDEKYDLREYDEVFLGSFINQGMINERTRLLLEAHRNKLMKKSIHLFCCGIDKQDYERAIQESLDPDMFYHIDYFCPGGEVRYDELTKKEKKIIKKRIGITKSVREFNTVLLDNLKKD